MEASCQQRLTLKPWKMRLNAKGNPGFAVLMMKKGEVNLKQLLMLFQWNFGVKPFR